MKVQFDMESDRITEIDRLMKQTDITTRKDFINNAVSLFAWAINESHNGRILASIDEKNKRVKEVLMPALEAAAKRRKSNGKS